METEKQLGDWLKTYRRLIYRVVMIYAKDEASRDDLYQEIALALWRSLPQFRGDAKESTWIYRVALNTGMGFQRSDRKHAKSDLDPELLLDHPTESNQAELAWVYSRIRTLSVIDRSLVLLYLDGEAYESIAEILGVSSGSVGAKINRVKAKLRKALDESEEI